MKCKICGVETESGDFCRECREEIELLSIEILNLKKQVNLSFVDHHPQNEQHISV